MPRTARIKNERAIYHIMVRSISEILLFRNSDDINKYLEIMKKYKQLYLYNLYAYCFMNSHAHFAIDCNGSDISKIMKSINQSYAAYYNKKYQRHGHLFQDRFKSKLIYDDRYLITLSAYIHNNPKDIQEYKNDIEEYKYSSLGIYLGIRNDNYNIVDTSFILQHFSDNPNIAKKIYLGIINNYSDKNIEVEDEFKDESSEYRSERPIIIRNFKISDIINFISSYTGENFNINVKYNHKNTELKSICFVLIHSLSNLSCKEICTFVGNLTLSNVWKLRERGLELITTNKIYENIMSDFINIFTTA